MRITSITPSQEYPAKYPMVETIDTAKCVSGKINDTPWWRSSPSNKSLERYKLTPSLATGLCE
jgi:hypothetical protein